MLLDRSLWAVDLPFQARREGSKEILQETEVRSSKWCVTAFWTRRFSRIRWHSCPGPATGSSYGKYGIFLLSSLACAYLVSSSVCSQCHRSWGLIDSITRTLTVGVPFSRIFPSAVSMCEKACFQRIYSLFYPTSSPSHILNIRPEIYGVLKIV